jgi:hypothetical protein
MRFSVGEGGYAPLPEARRKAVHLLHVCIEWGCFHRLTLPRSRRPIKSSPKMLHDKRRRKDQRYCLGSSLSLGFIVDVSRKSGSSPSSATFFTVWVSALSARDQHNTLRIAAPFMAPHVDDA